MKKICPLCGTANEDDASFCKECGELLNIDSQIKKEEPDVVQREKEIARAETEDEKLAKREKRKKDFHWLQRLAYMAIGFLLALALLYIYPTILWSVVELNDEKAQPTETDIISLTATVSFTGKQFLITNIDHYDWVDVKMELNNEFFHEINSLSAGDTYTVEAFQFTKDDGTRFNPEVNHPSRFRISSQTPSGKTVFWSGRSG